MGMNESIFEEAQRLLVEGKVKESIGVFTRAIDGGSKSDIVYLSRGVAYLKNHNPDEALDDFDMVVKHDDQNFRGHFYKGIAHLTKEEYENAITELNRTIELKPEHGPSFFARGTAYAQIGNDELAVKNMKTAITLSESNLFGLQETIGLWRTQFDKSLSILSGDKKPPEMSLTDDEHRTINKWLEQEYGEETFR
jgi:tetratricopeptide (TPR) repeat protein